MDILSKGSDVILSKVNDFNIEEIMECGQCFHFIKIQPMEYVLAAFHHLLHIRQEGDCVVLYNTDLNTFYNVWHHYFDLSTDYGFIKKELIKRDVQIVPAIDAHGGIRLLNQPFFETMMSFIISQNKQIPHIKQIVAGISEKYGDYLGTINSVPMYSFPSPKQLRPVSEDDFRACKTGFRAPYLVDAVEKTVSGVLSADMLIHMDDEQCLDALMQVKGIGRKVAGCIALFALGRRSAFPIDVWIQRIMETIYFNGEAADKKAIEALAEKLFGACGGYAQQYLFYYARGN